MNQSFMGKVRKSVFHAGSKPIHAFIEQALRDEDTYAWLTHTMGNNIAMSESGIADFVPEGISSIDGFEDCSWLYSSNPLNHGPSRLRFDEAAYLYKLVSNLQSPRVIEIGRYKGGTTLLLAAAGAEVISLDNDEISGQHTFTDSLNLTLERFGLGNSTTVLICEALEYRPEPESFDLVFLDNGLDSFQLAKTFFDYWWGAVKPGRYFLFRDGKETVLSKTAEYVSTLPNIGVVSDVDFDLPGAYVLCTKRD